MFKDTLYSIYIVLQIVNVLGDRMTQCRYKKPIETFDHGFRPEKWFEVDVIKKGRKALEEVNLKLGKQHYFIFKKLTFLN